jgi:hypothetical protein
MHTEIGHLRLTLPAGFEARAQRLGSLLGEALAARSDLPAGHIEQLGIGPLQIDAGHSDRAIAEHLAGAIHAALTQGKT